MTSTLRLLGRISLRFVALFVLFYLLIYIVPFPLSSLPLPLFEQLAAHVETPAVDEPLLWLAKKAAPASQWLGEHVSAPYAQWMDAEVKSFGARFFDLKITIGPAGSGDTTWNYVQLVGFGYVALGAALIATTLSLAVPWLARRGPMLLAWAKALIRFDLATTMILYGSIKVIKSQMSTPGIDELMVPFGEHSPMNLLWSYVGFSHAYCVFTGASEMIGGLLLCSRRTATLGALVAAGVMAHVAMMNFCFDTPVKLFSLHLVVMALWLAGPDLLRVLGFFVLQRPIALTPVVDLVPWRPGHWVAVALRTLFIAGVTFLHLDRSWKSRNEYGDLAPKAPLYGAWDVDIFEVDGELVSEDSEAVRWKRLLIGRYRMGVDRSDGSRTVYRATRPSAKGDRIDVSKEDDPSWARTFKCVLTTPDTLVVESRFDGHDLHLELTRAPDPFLLTNRGFHWINEFPLNR